jgi:hypothetical protein
MVATNDSEMNQEDVTKLLIRLIRTPPEDQFSSNYGYDKLLVDILAIGPTSMLAYFVKKLEGIDFFEDNLKFNPFKINLA